jgi:predicted nucleic acid-binding protein
VQQGLVGDGSQRAIARRLGVHDQKIRGEVGRLAEASARGIEGQASPVEDQLIIAADQVAIHHRHLMTTGQRAQ